MKKIIMSISTISAIALAVAGATGAFFNDVETSATTTLTSGTLNIDLTDSVGAIPLNLGSISNLAPGETTPSATIKVKNSGSINAATFAKIKLVSDTGLVGALKLYNWKVDYFKADGTPSPRWATKDPYYGVGVNEDWFIKDGVAHSGFVAAGGSANLSAWLTGNGALDVPGTPNDMEGLKANGSYYVVTLQFQMDPAANNAFQGKSAALAFEVDATQLNTDAIVGLGLGGSYNDPTYVGPNVTPYLTSQMVLY
jgi:hypothetical protein